MSKYSVGDKFVIEIKEVVENGASFNNEYMFDGGIWLMGATLDKLVPFDTTEFTKGVLAMTDVVNCEVDKAYRNGYEKGLQDAWELAGRCISFNSDGRLKIFDTDNPYCILREQSYEEALARLEAYEKEQAEIKVGDVVRFKKQPSCEVLITAVSRGLNGVHLQTGEFGKKGEVHSDICKDYIEKTGKHINIESLLEQIAE